MAKEVPDKERVFFRKVRGTERIVGQGFPKSTRLQLPGLSVKAAGNAYPVPLIIANLHGMINAIGNPAFAFASWPPKEVVSTVSASLMRTIMRMLNARGRVVDKAKARFAQAKAKAKAKTLKRKNSFLDP